MAYIDAVVVLTVNVLRSDRRIVEHTDPDRLVGGSLGYVLVRFEVDPVHGLQRKAVHVCLLATSILASHSRCRLCAGRARQPRRRRRWPPPGREAELPNAYLFECMTVR